MKAIQNYEFDAVLRKFLMQSRFSADGALVYAIGCSEGLILDHEWPRFFFGNWGTAVTHD